MMKKILLLGALYMGVQGQLLAQTEYVNYSAYVNAIAGFVQSGDTALWNRAMHSLQKDLQLVKEETAVSLPKTTVGTKQMTDENIYSKRKNSVLIIGRLRKGAGTNVNFDVMGTAFLVSKEGHCITNYHVIQQPAADELVYFVITADKQCYVVNELVSYSKNNDLAIFRIDGKGRQFEPIPIGKPAEVGAPVYCISHPAGELYYFSKGMVNRNVARDSASLGTVFSTSGRTPIRMEVSADYGGGSSGGPIMDQQGNLVGIVTSTNTIYLNEAQADAVKQHPQMVIKSTIPVKALTDLLKRD
jgi:serine protease Do